MFAYTKDNQEDIMDIKAILESRHKRNDAIAIKDYIIQNPKAISELMDLFFGESLQLCQRSSWSLLFLGLEAPEIIRPYLSQMVDSMPIAKHNAQIRNTIRIFEEIDIPEDLEGPLFELCFNYLMDHNKPTAIRAFSLRVLEKIAERHPDLKQELIGEIELQKDYGTVGFKGRAKKVLARLKRSV